MANKRQRVININLDGKKRESALCLIANLFISPEQLSRGMTSRIAEQGRMLFG